MLIDVTKPFKAVCVRHNCELEPGGQSRFLGGESWPGISYDYPKKEWFLDMSELVCPKYEPPSSDDPTDEELDDAECSLTWEWRQ